VRRRHYPSPFPFCIRISEQKRLTRESLVRIGPGSLNCSWSFFFSSFTAFGSRANRVTASWIFFHPSVSEVEHWMVAEVIYLVQVRQERRKTKVQRHFSSGGIA